MFSQKMNKNLIISEILENSISKLSESDSCQTAYLPSHGKPMPSSDSLREIVNLLREILFPGYFGTSNLKPENVRYYLGVNVDKVFQLLSTQIRRGICFACREEKNTNCKHCEDNAPELAAEFISRLPQIRQKLSTDVKAIFDGDPAVRSYGEVIYCYPTIRVMTNHRIAHELLKLEIPLIPRIISEMAHSETGIDIHPGAEIGEYFAIDHGTGVVIGETCVIGKNVKLYQGVTLGAKSFPLDENGNPIKGIPRHPIVRDNVVIYAQATVLGRITIGENSTIGGNVWVTQDVSPNSKIVQQKSTSGAGI